MYIPTDTALRKATCRLFVSQVLRFHLKDEIRSLCSVYYQKVSKGFLPVVSHVLNNSEEMQMLMPLIVEGYTAGEYKNGWCSAVKRERNWVQIVWHSHHFSLCGSNRVHVKLKISLFRNNQGGSLIVKVLNRCRVTGRMLVSRWRKNPPWL